MMILRLLIALATAAALAAAGVAYAGGVDVAIDPGGWYETACGGGVIDVTLGPENDLTAECAYDGTEHVICGQPGAVDWELGQDGQIVVTCSMGPK